MDEYEEWKELFPLLKGVYKKMKLEWHNSIDCSFSMNQTRMILYLNNQSPMMSTELAELLLITAGGVTLMADKLIDKGLIRRFRSEEDRRVVYLAINDEGKKHIDTFKKNDDAVIRYMYERISKEDLSHIRRIFTLLND